MRNKFYKKAQRLKKVRPLTNVKKRELLSKVVIPKKVEPVKLEEAVEPIPTEPTNVDLTPETTLAMESTENTNKETPTDEQVQTVTKSKRTRKPKAVVENTDENNVENKE